MKGDRFDAVVAKEATRQGKNGFWIWNTPEYQAQVATLLRKEYAAVRNEVLAYRRKLNYGRVVPGDKHAKGMIDGSIETCNDILSALDRRAKGGTK